MSKTSLKPLVGSRPALMTFKEDHFWPIANQFMGVEIELEEYSDNEMHTHLTNGEPFWTQHRDGSLRGRRAVELVLNQPMMGDALKEAIHYFFRTFKTYQPSPRTSIHVHINMLQDEESLEGLKNMVVLYYMYENAFFAIADENRKWNGYCNPFDEAPPEILQALMQYDDIRYVGKHLMNSAAINQNRYYGLNINALQRYGTLEFRHLPLVTQEDRLLDWMRLIMELKAAGNRMADEGVTPGQVFQTPDDLIKLQEYMPSFGKTLLELVDQGTAFVRMANVNCLRVAKNQRHRSVEGNAAWARFLETQTKAGRKVVEHADALGKMREPDWENLARVANAEAMAADMRAIRERMNEPPRLRVRAPQPLRPPAARIRTVQQEGDVFAQFRADAEPAQPAMRMWVDEGVNDNPAQPGQ